MYTYAIQLSKNNSDNHNDIPHYMAINTLTEDDKNDAFRIIEDMFDIHGSLEHLKKAIIKAIGNKTCFGMYHYGKLISIAAYDFLFKGHLFAATDRSWLRNGCAGDACRAAMDDMYKKDYRYALAIAEDDAGIKFIESLGGYKYVGSHMSILSEFSWNGDDDS